MTEFREREMTATTLFSDFAFPRSPWVSMICPCLWVKFLPWFHTQALQTGSVAVRSGTFLTCSCSTQTQEHGTRPGPSYDCQLLIFLLEICCCQENEPAGIPRYKSRGAGTPLIHCASLFWTGWVYILALSISQDGLDYVQVINDP